MLPDWQTLANLAGIAATNRQNALLQEQNEVQRDISQKLDALRREEERRRSLPRCPHCGGGFEGEYGTCTHCRKDLGWVYGQPCKAEDKAKYERISKYGGMFEQEDKPRKMTSGWTRKLMGPKVEAAFDQMTATKKAAEAAQELTNESKSRPGLSERPPSCKLNASASRGDSYHSRLSRISTSAPPNPIDVLFLLFSIPLGCVKYSIGLPFVVGYRIANRLSEGDSLVHFLYAWLVPSFVRLGVASIVGHYLTTHHL